MLFETFYPDTWVDSTYQIDFDELYKKGLTRIDASCSSSA